jgi:hypothetical protein
VQNRIYPYNFASKLADARSPLMKRILSVFLVFILVSCVSGPTAALPTVVVTETIVPTVTSRPPTPVTSAIPSITPTVEPPCDPFIEDFCITEGHFIFQRPIHRPANDLVDPAYRYGATANDTRDPHHGVEFPNPSGTPVHAATEGTVIFAGPDDQAIYSPWSNFYGNLVVIQHREQLFTLYAHLSRIDVEVNQKISAGMKIGEVGRTGGAIGSHLHFEVRRGNVEDYFATQNPELWLVPAREVDGNVFGVLQLSVVDEKRELVKTAKFTIGYYADPSQPPAAFFYGTPYSPDLLTGSESAVFGELPSGQYRIAVETNGQLLERWVEVQSGRLTQVLFVIN